MTDRKESRLVPLTNGTHSAIVDASDFPRVSSLNWTYNKGYAVRSHRSKDGVKGTQTMHGLITGWTGVDHINGNRLDNRKTNLRPASPLQNGRNKRKPSDNRTGYKGVQFRRDAFRSKPWYAIIATNRKKLYLGAYSTPEEAALAYDSAARDLFGEFAALNFPEPGESAA